MSKVEATKILEGKSVAFKNEMLYVKGIVMIVMYAGIASLRSSKLILSTEPSM